MDDLPEYTENDILCNYKEELPKTKLHYSISMLIKDFSMKYRYVYGLWYGNIGNMLSGIKRSYYDDDDNNDNDYSCIDNRHDYTCEMLDTDVKILLDTISELIADNKIFIQFKMTQNIISGIYSIDDMRNKYKYLRHFPDFFNGINYLHNNICILDENSHISELAKIEQFKESFAILGPKVFENNNFTKIFDDQ